MGLLLLIEEDLGWRFTPHLGKRAKSVASGRRRGAEAELVKPVIAPAQRIFAHLSEHAVHTCPRMVGPVAGLLPLSVDQLTAGFLRVHVRD